MRFHPSKRARRASRLTAILTVAALSSVSCGLAHQIVKDSGRCRRDDFNQYAGCVDDLLAASIQPEAVALRKELPGLIHDVWSARLTTQQAIDRVEAKLLSWAAREEREVQQAFAIGATAVVVGAAVAASQNNGAKRNKPSAGGGGGYSVKEYSAVPPARGCCSWHGGISQEFLYGTYRCGAYGRYTCEYVLFKCGITGRYLCADGWESTCDCK